MSKQPPTTEQERAQIDALPQIRRVYKAFTLPPEHAELLRKRAKPDCTRCQGSGIKKWKSGGLQAVLCDAPGCAESRTAGVEISGDTQQVVPLPPMKKAALTALHSVLGLFKTKAK